MKQVDDGCKTLTPGPRECRRIVIPGGSGHLGVALTRAFLAAGDEVVVLSRKGAGRPKPDQHLGHGAARFVIWDGRGPGDWQAEIDGADVIINLAGRSVDCRYNKRNLEQMLSSRIDSTHAVGRAIESANSPPALWLQMSTATIYAHRFDAPNDEARGRIGGSEPDVPGYWRTSVHIAQEWERALDSAEVPGTRRVALRTAMVMGARPGGAFHMFRRLARLRLGGAIAGGRAFMSWIHERDFVRSIQFLIEHDELEGPINLAAPEPLPQAEFMGGLRAALGIRMGLSATKAMIEIGALALGTDPELVLKSRRVVPAKLSEAGFQFDFPHWPQAAQDLVA